MSDKSLLAILCLILVVSFASWGQDDKASSQEEKVLPKSILSRWRLNFKMLGNPESIIVTDPSGKREAYWYFLYEIVNDSGRRIPWRGDLRLVIDKTREGVAEIKVPGLFNEATIPEEKEGSYYLLIIETRETVKRAKTFVWEVVLFQDEDNNLSLVNRRLLDMKSGAEYALPPKYIGDNKDPEVFETAEFISIDMNKVDDFEVSEINKMANQILPLLDPKYSESNISVNIPKAARQIGMKEYNTSEIYANRLRTYFDVDLPVIKNEIMEKLQLYPKLTPQENIALMALEPQKDEKVGKTKTAIELVGPYYLLALEIQAESGNVFWEVILQEDNPQHYTLIGQREIQLENYAMPSGFTALDPRQEEVYQKAKDGTMNLLEQGKYEFKELHHAGSFILSYEEAENALTNLVVRKLVLPEETPEDPVWVGGGKASGLKFLVRKDGKAQEVVIREGDTAEIAGWVLISCEESDDTATKITMKKGDVITGFYPGATLEYFYSKTYRYFVERNDNYAAGLSARGTYKGYSTRNQYRGSSIRDRFVYENLVRRLEDQAKEEGGQISEANWKGKAEDFDYLDKNADGVMSEGEIKNPFSFEDAVIPPKKEFLFNAYLAQKNREVIDEGDAPGISGMFQTMFKSNGVRLSQNPEVTQENAGEWQIKDPEDRTVYFAARYKDNLTVYRQNNDYVHYGVAIFSDVSPEMDFMGVIVSGLVDPVVLRQYHLETPDGTQILQKSYLENEVYMIGFQRPGDEFTSQDMPVEYIYEKWIVLSRKQLRSVTRSAK